MSLTLLIAFAPSHYQETILKAPSDWPFDLCLFCPFCPSCSLGGKVTHEQAYNSPKMPLSWRWFSLNDSCQPTAPAMGWPSALQLHLFGTALISMAVWFYSLHLKLCGHSWFQ